ncbi:unnamed protein product [Meganyctiphanes norvegica]|uniref:DUF4503 domain-containing protein n=1 Tax=Meganyctiphanes norvegica TaxID=48144 RepID=A0AAV2RCP9_MEGNR
MSKRKHGGVWTRKASKLAAKEGWSERESNIKDFMKCSPELIDSQNDLDIECASSDEEGKSSKSVKTEFVQKIYKPNSDQQIKKKNTLCNFKDKLKDFGIHNKRILFKRHIEHKSLDLCLASNKDGKVRDATVIEQLPSHKYNKKINEIATLSTVKVKVDESDDEKEFKISPVNVTHQSTSKSVERCQQDKKYAEKDINSYHSVKRSFISEKKSPVFKTPKHFGNSSPTSSSPQKKSPVFSSRRKREQFEKNILISEHWSPIFKSKVKSTDKSPKIGTQNIVELESPVLKSKILRDPGSPVFNSRKVLKRKLTFGYDSTPNKPSVTDVLIEPLNEHATRNCFSDRKKIAEHSSPVLKSKVRSTYKSPKIGTQNIAELESPALKSKNLKHPGSPVLNSRVLKRKLSYGYHSAPNKPLIKDVPVQSLTEITTRSSFCKRKRISENVFTPLSGKGNSVLRIKKKQRNLAQAFIEHKEDNFKGSVEIKEVQSESEHVSDRMELTKVENMSKGNFTLEGNPIIKKKSNDEMNMNFKMKTNLSLLNSYQNCYDQSIMVIEDINDTVQVQSEAQESEPIEECMTPTKEISSYNIHYHTEPWVKSLSKCSKNTISVQEENEGGQKGSEWLRALHQKTPDRPSKDNEQIADPDSSKKKILKDGLAARLRRLMPSWQSSVQMWKHQISVSGEQNPQKSPACSTAFQTPKLPKLSQSSDISDTSDKSERRQAKEKLWRAVKSPGLRNLQCALLVGPTESSKRQEINIELPKKHLLLKIVKIGGRLPAGGALCEKVDGLDINNPYSIIKDRNSERFVVIFATQEQNDAFSFQVNDQVKIYSPWHHLDLPGQNIPTLFSSFFIIHSRKWQSNEGKAKKNDGEWNKSRIKRKMNKKKIILTSWSCLCSTNSTISPTMCEGRNFHLKHKADMFNVTVNNEQHDIENVSGSFKVIQESSKNLPIQNCGKPQSWSIVEAIEKCGGLSDIPVTVILHVYRIIKIKDLLGNNDHWLLVGADIMGVFCTVTIPDRPLARDLSSLLDDGEGTVHALTQLTVTQRLTDNQNPGLFSLLHSLYHAYHKSIKENENLMTIYIHNERKVPPTFCYNFTVILGSTTSQLVTGIPNVPISLPLWSVAEALKVCGVAVRGSTFFHIIYKIDMYLYVICPDEYPKTSDQSIYSVKSKEESRLSSTITIDSSKADDSICKDIVLSLSNNASRVTRVSLQEGSTLPTWLTKNGTIMQGAIVRDIISYKGTLMVDEFSEIKIKKSEVNLTLGNLYRILPKLQLDSNSHQLVHVSGNISYVDEENAFSWPICEHCTSEKLHDTGAQSCGMKCLKCGKISLSPDTGYSLEIFLDCKELSNNSVNIKLYQRTIKKLMSMCLVSEGESYDATLMIGRVLGPLVCFIEEVKSRTNTNPRTFILLQLPY